MVVQCVELANDLVIHSTNTPYYKVLFRRNYYKVLHSTTKYYSILQSITKYYIPRTTKYHKVFICLIVATHKITPGTMRETTGATLEFHQILRLPRPPICLLKQRQLQLGRPSLIIYYVINRLLPQNPASPR